MDSGIPEFPPAAPTAKITDRFLAYLVDTVPFFAGYYASLIFLVAKTSQVSVASPQTRFRVFFAWLVLYLIYQWVGNVAGATIGKGLMGLRVRGLDGERLGAGRAFTRSLAMLVSTPLCNLGFLWALVQPDSRTWHDLLAGSRVVEARPKTAGESLANAILAFTALAAIIGATWWFYMIRPTPEDAAAVERARQGLRILAQIEERYKAVHGTYTDKLANLAAASGDVALFKDGMRGLYDPRRIAISAGKNHYYFHTLANDRKKTPVTLSGP